MITSYSYKIGTDAGMYPVDVKITDSLLGVGDVTSICCHTQDYNTGFVQNKATCTLEFGDAVTVSAGDVVTLFFKEPVILQVA